ncbi:MAG: AraC family transcriptional regulator [Gemmatimonadetes bacterium]|nr:MAG: AraC family transcriptional regulator [Gemmatimonadota bacterium]
MSFYVVARGSAWLEVRGGRPLPLSTGDAVILPLGSAHELRDVDRRDVPPLSFDFDACPREPHAARAGGDGPVTSIILGLFTLGSAPRNALLASLPSAIHLPAGAVSASPQLAGLVPLILSESGSPGAGSSIVLARLADLLFVHALRFWISTVDAPACGLGAVADPAIGGALRLMHARPAEPWTVERLGSSVAMSRSAFAARFSELVGESPLQYLASWRMTLAAQRLREDDAVIATWPRRSATLIRSRSARRSRGCRASGRARFAGASGSRGVRRDRQRNARSPGSSDTPGAGKLCLPPCAWASTWGEREPR